MTSDVNIAKHAAHDKLEAQIKTAEAKLDTLKARAETAKADAEIKAIPELVTKKAAIRQQLHELKKSGGDTWEKTKTALEAHIADFEKSVKALESKARAKSN